MLLCKSTVPVLVSFQDAIYWEMLRQCCRQNIPLSQFACFWSHDFTTHHSLCEKNRCDREWNQFKKIQISFCNIFKYKWLLGQPGHQGRVYMWVCGTGNLPVSKKGSEQTQIGRRIREEGVGEKTFCFAEQELLDAPSCLYILKNIFNGNLDSPPHFH